MNNNLKIISLINIKMSLFTNTKNKSNVVNSSNETLYNLILINKTIHVSINNVGSNIKETLEKVIASQIEGKCIVEGYIKPKSIEVITFSSGLVNSSNIIFEVIFQCYVCSPVEGMYINCIAKHINKAGIRAEVKEIPSPVVIFIARDHNYSSPLFSQVKENDNITIRVIGQRFELNDTYISIIAEIVDSSLSIKQPNANLEKSQVQPITTKKKLTIKVRKPLSISENVV